MEAKIHLQGIGLHNAILANQLRVGMRITYNFGSTAEVISVIPTKSGKSVVVATKTADGKEYTRRYLVSRLVAVKTK